MSLFYILSLKHSPSPAGHAVWWGPNNRGYVFDLRKAGLYTEDQITADPSYYDNKKTTQAWRKENAEAHAKAQLLANYHALRIAAQTESETEVEPERDEPIIYNRGELPERDSRGEHNRTL